MENNVQAGEPFKRYLNYYQTGELFQHIHGDEMEYCPNHDSDGGCL